MSIKKDTIPIKNTEKDNTPIMNTENEISPEPNHQNYEERISSLKFEKTPMGELCLYELCWHYPYMVKGIIYLQDNFCAKPTDIFLCSFPKTGTTWLKTLTFAIVTRTRFNLSSSPLLTTMPHDCLPFIELELEPGSPVQRDPELPLLATHLPYTSLPKSIISSGCKIVYIYRDPKDVLVSLWHYMCKLAPSNPIGLPEFFNLFMKGVVNYGPIWDHVLSYWKASLERPGTILLLRYEDLMIDTEFYVKKLAEFVECPFSAEEENEGVVGKLVKLCSFETISNLDINKTGSKLVAGTLKVNNSAYFRKGQSGDWKNYMTLEMAEEMDKITYEKFAACGLMVPLKNHR